MGAGFFNMKFQAIKFLQKHDSSAVKIEELKEVNQGLMERLEALEAKSSDEPKKRGRPPKIKVD